MKKVGKGGGVVGTVAPTPTHSHTSSFPPSLPSLSRITPATPPPPHPRMHLKPTHATSLENSTHPVLLSMLKARTRNQAARKHG